MKMKHIFWLLLSLYIVMLVPVLGWFVCNAGITYGLLVVGVWGIMFLIVWWYVSIVGEVVVMTR